MKVNHHQIVRILVLLTCYFAASLAQAAAFNISYFDQNNLQVGQGQFTTDPSQHYTVINDPEHMSNVCLENGISLRDCGVEVDILNPVIKFSAEIQGVTWPGKEDGMAIWWKANGQLPGSMIQDRTGSGIGDNFWFIGAPFFGTRQFYMNINQATELSGSGTWGQSAGYDQYGNPLPAWVDGFGTWTATATPIPAAVWLFASGLGALGALRRKMNVKK